MCFLRAYEKLDAVKSPGDASRIHSFSRELVRKTPDELIMQRALLEKFQLTPSILLNAQSLEQHTREFQNLK